VNKLGGECADGEAGGDEVGPKFFQAKRGEGGGAAEDQHGREKERDASEPMRRGQGAGSGGVSFTFGSLAMG
jgi:hypothetical protein